MIHLVDIDEGNWRVPLKVSKEQDKYVANSTTILARAYAYRNSRSCASLIYEDECMVLNAQIQRYDSIDPDVENDYEFSISFLLKTIGGIGSK